MGTQLPPVNAHSGFLPGPPTNRHVAPRQPQQAINRRTPHPAVVIRMGKSGPHPGPRWILLQTGNFPLPTFSKTEAPTRHISWATIVKMNAGPARTGGPGRPKLSKAQKRMAQDRALVKEHKANMRQDARSFVLAPCSEDTACKQLSKYLVGKVTGAKLTSLAINFKGALEDVRRDAKGRIYI